MKELIHRIEQTQRLRPECLICTCNNYLKKCPEGTPPFEQAEYMQKVLLMLGEAKQSTAIPVIVRDIRKLQEQMFGIVTDYKELKKHFNQILLEQYDSFKERIESAPDPLKLAMQLAMIGNYIDFPAVGHVDEDFLNQMLKEAEEKIFDERTYQTLKMDLEKGGSLVFFTDNCGEVVLDKLLIEEIQKRYPRISVTAIVRGLDAVNDATLEDARQVGLDQIVQVVGNGNDIPGTWFPEITKEAGELIKQADVMIAKGQANFETMRGCGLNIYYLFLCKCEMFSKMFQVDPLSGMLVNDKELKEDL